MNGAFWSWIRRFSVCLASPQTFDNRITVGPLGWFHYIVEIMLMTNWLIHLRLIVYLIERGGCIDGFDLPFLACLSLVDILCTGFAVIENTALAWAALQK